MSIVSVEMCVDAIEGPLSYFIANGLSGDKQDEIYEQFRKKYPSYDFKDHDINLYRMSDSSYVETVQSSDDRYLETLEIVASYFRDNSIDENIEYNGSNDSIFNRFIRSFLATSHGIQVPGFGRYDTWFFGPGCCSLHELLDIAKEKANVTAEIITLIIGSEEEQTSAGVIKGDHPYSQFEIDSYIIENRGYLLSRFSDNKKVKERLLHDCPNFDEIEENDWEYYADCQDENESREDIVGKTFYFGVLKWGAVYYGYGDKEISQIKNGHIAFIKDNDELHVEKIKPFTGNDNYGPFDRDDNN